ncbi:14479_t:CDS:1, partial [Ambispora leptoticha]
KITADEVFGIIPYVVPEVLQIQKYTTASDIYSFGMIMWEIWEIWNGKRPFNNRSHDIALIFDVCGGIRPDIPVDMPKHYRELMIRC